MHKFQPRVYLVQRADGSAANVQDIELEKFRTFVFPETQFTAVTAYQNQLVILKKKNLYLQLRNFHKRFHIKLIDFNNIEDGNN